MASIAGLAVCVTVALAAPARALSVLPDPAVFNLDLGGGTLLKGSIDFVAMVTGTPIGGVVLAGSVAPTDVTFVFTITLDADAATDVLFSTVVYPEPPIAASPVFAAVGTIPAPGPDIVDAVVSAGVAYWNYAPLPSPGETVDPFFLSFSSVSAGDQFKMEEVVLPLGMFTVVPEPGTLGILAISFVVLAWRARSFSRKRPRL
jgi:hypothetical protein